MVTVRDSTLAYNGAAEGSGIATQGGSSATLYNTIVADSTYYGSDLYIDSGYGSTFFGAYDLSATAPVSAASPMGITGALKGTRC